MAQVLKDEFRQAIINAAKQEFLEKGYKNASMRSIAAKANMTVGNLYRYFKNKEEINLSIVGPTYKKIDYVLKTLSKDNISMEPRVFNIKPDSKQLKQLVNTFSNELVKIYYSSPTEFNILMLHSKLSEKIVEWFSDISKSLIFDTLNISGNSNIIDDLSNAFAKSVFSGIQSIFLSADNSIKKTKDLLSYYLNSYIDMLNNDIRKLNE